jgi:hypothetical protein
MAPLQRAAIGRLGGLHTSDQIVRRWGDFQLVGVSELASWLTACDGQDESRFRRRLSRTATLNERAEPSNGPVKSVDSLPEPACASV